jgi:predicted nicotinamide N-methyase
MSALSSLLAFGVPPESESAQQKAYVTYSFCPSSTGESVVAEKSVTLLESRAVISSSGTTGLRTWEAALHLGAFLCSEEGLKRVRGKRVFELGAGTGMLSILCAKHLGVTDVVATDGDEAVVDAIKSNSFLNGVDADNPPHSMVRTAALRWGWPLNASTFAEDYGMGLPEVVLGADVVKLTTATQVLERLTNVVADVRQKRHSSSCFVTEGIVRGQPILACAHSSYNTQ